MVAKRRPSFTHSWPGLFRAEYDKNTILVSEMLGEKKDFFFRNSLHESVQNALFSAYGFINLTLMAD